MLNFWTGRVVTRVDDRSRRRLKTLAAILTATLVLAWPAIFNGFPLVFDDTGTYLHTGITLVKNGWVELSWSRSVVYGLTTAPAFLLSSVWVVIILQALVAASGLYLLLRALTPELALWQFLGAMLVLAAVSSLPWLVSWVMPDLFSGMVILMMFATYWFAGATKWWETAVYASFTALAIATHYSHIPLAAGLFVVLVAMSASPYLRPKRPFEAAGYGLGTLALGMTLLFVVNAAGGKPGLFGTSGDIFLLARFLEDGPAYRYLQADCGTRRQYRLCMHLSELRRDSNWLLWDPESPFYEIGIRQLAVEASDIVGSSLRRYPVDHMRNSLTASVQQFTSFETGTSFGPFARVQDKSVNRVLMEYYPSEWDAYVSARQARADLIPGWLPPVHTVAVLVSVMFILLRLPGLIRQGRAVHTTLVITVTLGLIGNAVLAGALSTVDDRYQSRVIWLVPFVALVLLVGSGRTALFAAGPARGRTTQGRPQTVWH